MSFETGLSSPAEVQKPVVSPANTLSAMTIRGVARALEIDPESFVPVGARAARIEAGNQVVAETE